MGQLAGGYIRYHEKYKSLLCEYTDSLFSSSLFLSEMDNRKLPYIGHNPLPVTLSPSSARTQML